MSWVVGLINQWCRAIDLSLKALLPLAMTLISFIQIVFIQRSPEVPDQLQRKCMSIIFKHHTGLDASLPTSWTTLFHERIDTALRRTLSRMVLTKRSLAISKPEKKLLAEVAHELLRTTVTYILVANNFESDFLEVFSESSLTPYALKEKLGIFR